MPTRNPADLKKIIFKILTVRKNERKRLESLGQEPAIITRSRRGGKEIISEYGVGFEHPLSHPKLQTEWLRHLDFGFWNSGFRHLEFFPSVQVGSEGSFSFGLRLVFHDGDLVDRFLVGSLGLVTEFLELLLLQPLQDFFFFGERQ